MGILHDARARVAAKASRKAVDRVERAEPDAAPRAATRTGGTRPESRRANVHARRFDADRTDEVLEFDEALGHDPSNRQLLWIDITGTLDAADVDRLCEAFELDARSRRWLESPPSEPRLSVRRRSVHVAVAAEPDARKPHASQWLSMITAANVVITQHDDAIDFLEDIDESVEADASFGAIGSRGFVAAILDAAVTSYFKAVDEIEEEVDELDARSLRDPARDELLHELVAVRRRIAALRRLLAEHRSVFGGLPTLAPEDPDQDETENTTERAAFAAVADRFVLAMNAVEASREVLLGSFDVYMTRTAQRTNDVMKILTMATVILLPGTLVAGLLGMNVIVPLPKENPASFWIVIASVAILGLAIALVARRKRWL